MIDGIRSPLLATSDIISKANCIIEYCKEKAIELKDIIFVDDVITILREAERKGIESWHISSFLDWQFYNE